MTLIDLQPTFDFLGRFTGGPENALIIAGALIKIGLVLGSVLGAVPFLVLAERRLIALVQDRPGPNRVGPFGLLQAFADGLKLFLKEDFIPAGADRLLYLLGPPLVIIPSFLALCIVPFGPIIEGQALLDLYTLFGLQGMWSPNTQTALAISNPNIGILYVFAITSLGVYGFTLAGWSSENKWSLLGGIRASAQMISYEISLSLSIIGVLLIAGTLNLYEIVDGQGGGFWRWNVFAQPVGFLLFLTSIFAETNRLPFDLAEGESELTGGYHTEYSSMKFAMFFMAEYANMVTAAAVCATLFLGGYFFVPQAWVEGFFGAIFGWLGSSQAGIVLPGTMPTIVASVLAPLGLAVKIAFFVALFIMVRAMWPRMRYDQVMNLGWKVMLPAGLVNLFVTAIGVALISWAAVAGMADATPGEARNRIYNVVNDWKWVIGLITFAMLIGADRFYASRRRRKIASLYRHTGGAKSGTRRGREVLST